MPPHKEKSMKLIVAVLAVGILAGVADAGDIFELHRLGAGDVAAAQAVQAPPPAAPYKEQIPGGYYHFPRPAVDSCIFTALQADSCRYACASGRITFEPPVLIVQQGSEPSKVCADSVFITIPAFRGAGKAAVPQYPQVPPFNPIWNINNGMNPLPQPPQTTLDVCEYTGFENGKCMFDCRNGDILAEEKLDNGEPGGVCASHIFRTIPSVFARRASMVRGLESMTRQEWERFVQTVREREIDDDHLSQQERREVLAEWIRRNPEDAEKLTGDMTTDYINLVLGYGRSARRGAEKRARGCLFRENKAEACVYSCDDGSDYVRPMKRPSPFGDEPVLPCPQVVFPF